MVRLDSFRQSYTACARSITYNACMLFLDVPYHHVLEVINVQIKITDYITRHILILYLLSICWVQVLIKIAVVLK